MVFNKLPWRTVVHQALVRAFLSSPLFHSFAQRSSLYFHGMIGPTTLTMYDLIKVIRTHSLKKTSEGKHSIRPFFMYFIQDLRESVKNLYSSKKSPPKF